MAYVVMAYIVMISDRPPCVRAGRTGAITIYIGAITIYIGHRRRHGLSRGYRRAGTQNDRLGESFPTVRSPCLRSYDLCSYGVCSYGPIQ